MPDNVNITPGAGAVVAADEIAGVLHQRVKVSVGADGVAQDWTGDVATSEIWRVSLQAEETQNDSDKMFVVPASTEWQILSIWVELVTTADVGNRQVTIEMQDDAGDIIGSFNAGAVQAASLTRNYMFAPGLEAMAAFVGIYLSTPLPQIFLPAGFKVRVYDSAAIAVAADDMVCQMMVAARTV
jgi:hypothetical protein